MGTKVKTCVVVGASPTTDSAFIKPILKQADYIICADGGWNHVYRTGVSPHLIVGDFDSACDIIPISRTQMVLITVRRTSRGGSARASAVRSAV